MSAVGCMNLPSKADDDGLQPRRAQPGATFLFLYFLWWSKKIEPGFKGQEAPYNQKNRPIKADLFLNNKWQWMNCLFFAQYNIFDSIRPMRWCFHIPIPGHTRHSS